MLLYSEASKGDETTIRESLGERLGHLTIESIRPSAMDGLFEVQLVEEGAINELGRRFGLEGTPTIIYEDGHVSGYLPAAAMVEKLGIAY